MLEKRNREIVYVNKEGDGLVEESEEQIRHLHLVALSDLCARVL